MNGSADQPAPWSADQAAVAAVARRNSTTTAYPRDAGLTELVGRHVQARPSAPAVIDGDRTATYEELGQRMNAVSRSLVEHGVCPGDAVGIFGRRGVGTVVAMLGVLAAGAAYVPLDAGYPAERRRAMADAAGVHIAISTAGDRPDATVRVISLDDRREQQPPRIVTSGDDLASIMFTSGSTGPPKAVGIRQRAVTRLVVDTNYVALTPEDRILHASSLSFDAATFEIWGALLNGAALVVADSNLWVSPPDLRQLLERESVTTAFVTTAIFHQLAVHPEVFHGLRTLVVGGEALDPGSARSVLAATRGTRILNGYGPTENTTFTTAFALDELPPDAVAVPIGTPIANTTCYVRREDGTLADVGEVGELVTGGDGVAVGYLNDPDATAARFIEDPYAADPAARLYRTGDLASWRRDGVLEFHGRRDDQFKMHGYRIEPGEVERAMMRHPAVAAAAVTRRDDPGTGEAYACGYVVAASGERLGSLELRHHLETILPTHLIPSAFVQVDELPMSPNGKVDRGALPTPPYADEQRVEAPPTGPADLEDMIRSVWNDVLGDRAPGRVIEPGDTLFDVGGTSFDVLETHGRVAARVDAPALTPLDLFTYPSLRGYAEHVAALLRASTNERRQR